MFAGISLPDPIGSTSLTAFNVAIGGEAMKDVYLEPTFVLLISSYKTQVGINKDQAIP